LHKFQYLQNRCLPDYSCLVTEETERREEREGWKRRKGKKKEEKEGRRKKGERKGRKEGRRTPERKRDEEKEILRSSILKRTIVSQGEGITGIFTVLTSPKDDNCLVVCHHLAQPAPGQQLRANGKSDFFLNASLGGGLA
jgi:hypothetical protein